MAARVEPPRNLEYLKSVSSMQPFVIQKIKPSSDARDLTVLVAGKILSEQLIYGIKGRHQGQSLTQLFTVGNAEMFFDVSGYAKDDSRFISSTESQQGNLEKWVKDGRNAVIALFVRQFGAFATIKTFDLEHIAADDETRSFTVHEFTEFEEVARKIARVVKKLKVELRRHSNQQ